MIGYVFCGSFCTLAKSAEVLRGLIECGEEVIPIMSERVYSTDTRFTTAAAFREKIEGLCGREIIHTVEAAEPLGPGIILDALIIAPCTGNTLSKLAHGITDSAATMAAKAHLRCDRQTLIALASNDAMSQNLENISRLLLRKSVYFVPMRQDDPKMKPHSLVADFDMLPAALAAMRKGAQIRPVFM